MRHRVQGGQVAFSCPVCGTIVPMFTVTVIRYGFLWRRSGVVIDGDATDLVAHLWTHRNPEADKSDIAGVI